MPQRLMPLLGFLALNRGSAFARATAARTLWPDEPDDVARANLRRHLHLLGQALEPHAAAFLNLEGSRVALNSDAPIVCDADDLDADGELLEGLEAPWIAALREQRRRERTARLQRAFSAAEERQDADAAAAAAESLLALDVVDEEIVRKTMLLRAQRNDRAGALELYRRFCDRLAHDFDAKPHDETIRIYERLLAQTPHVETPNNLPAPRTRFVGRETDCENVAQLLKTNRLVSIAGAGGIGKTRLALRVASNATGRFKDGIWYVDCRDAADAHALFSRLAQAIAGQAQVRDAAAFVIEKLKAANALVVLDTCEAALAAARRVCEALLGATPVRLLATTRRKLDAPFEYVYRLAPFALPQPGLAPAELANTEAGRLILDRAAIVAPDFAITHNNAAAIGEIVERLNGVPLAIELAFARLNLLTPEGIAKRLTDHFDHFARSSLHEIVRWSYELLAPRERALFVRLAVFPFDFTLEAVQAVCADGGDVFDVFSELVEASLVQMHVAGERARYTMLDSTRAFARELFDAEPEAHTVRERHARYYQEFVAAQRARFTTGQEHAYFDLAVEMANLRAVLTFAFARDFALAAQIVAEAGQFWYRMPFIEEGLALVTRVLTDERFPSLDPALQARTHHTAGTIQRVLSANAAAYEHMLQAKKLSEEAGDRVGTARALMGLGNARYYLGDYAGSREHYLAALPLMRAHCSPYELSTLLGNLGAAALSVGELEESERYLTESVAVANALGQRRFEAMFTVNVALVQYLRGNGAGAEAHARRAIALFEATQSENYRTAESYCKLSMALRQQRRYDEAWAANTHALSLLKDGRHKSTVAEALEDAAQTALAAGNPHGAAMAFARAERIRDEIGNPPNPIEVDELAAAKAAVAERLTPSEQSALASAALLLPLADLFDRLQPGDRTLLGHRTA